MRLTLRTLLAYLDDTLEPHEARDLGVRVSQSEFARELVERIKKATRRRGLATPSFSADGDVSDPNTVAEYLSDALTNEQVERVEENCLASDAHLAEIASCHQILTLLLTEPVRVPPAANRRMYKLVRKPVSQHDREPGRTMPIGRALPKDESSEAEEQDAALLLGMSRYTPGGPVGGRIIQGLLVAALAACLIVAVAMALPERKPRGPQIGTESFAAVTPTPATAPAPKLVAPSTVAVTPMETKKPAVVEPPPVEADPSVAPRPRLIEGVAIAKPVEPKPAPPPQPADPPRDVRKVVGKLEDANKVVVLTKSAQNVPERITPENPDISTETPILCLPGYKAKVRLSSGVIVDLWANTPEQLPSSLFETRLRFHEPPEGFDADISLRTGRLFLEVPKPGGGKVRIRAGSEVWDASFADNSSKALVEVAPTFDAGTPFIKDVPDSPKISVAFVITSGTVGLSLAGIKDFGPIAAPRYFLWDNQANGIEEGNDRNRMEYFSRFPLIPPDPVQQAQSLAMQKTLSDLAANLTVRDGSKTRIAELLSDEGDFSNLNRVMTARYAVYAAAAIDEPVYLVDALNSGLKPFLRVAATIALDRWLPVDGENTTRFYQQLLNKQFKEDDALLVVKLMRRYTPDDLKRPDVLDGLVNLMESSEHPAVRELAFWTLITSVDPTALENPKLSRFDAGGTPLEREPAISAWRQRLVDIKKRVEIKKT